jgi:hypothetical protein
VETVASPLVHATLARQIRPLPSTLKRAGERVSSQPSTLALVLRMLAKLKEALNPKSTALGRLVEEVAPAHVPAEDRHAAVGAYGPRVAVDVLDRPIEVGGLPAGELRAESDPGGALELERRGVHADRQPDLVEIDALGDGNRRPEAGHLSAGVAEGTIPGAGEDAHLGLGLRGEDDRCRAIPAIDVRPARAGESGCAPKRGGVHGLPPCSPLARRRCRTA